MTRDYVICRDRFGAKALCRWDSFGCAVGNGLKAGMKLLLCFRSSNFRKIVCWAKKDAKAETDVKTEEEMEVKTEAVYETDMWIPPAPLQFAGRLDEILSYGGAAVAIVEKSETHPNSIGEKVIIKLSDCKKSPRVKKNQS